MITLSEGLILGSCFPWEIPMFNTINLRVNEVGDMWVTGSINVPSISTHNSLISKYTITNYGRVFRWSPLHHSIKSYYLIARRNPFNGPMVSASGMTVTHLFKRKFKFGR